MWWGGVGIKVVFEYISYIEGNEIYVRFFGVNFWVVYFSLF